MFTTPLLSLNMPPRAAKISGVAFRIVEARSVPREVSISSTTAPVLLQVGARSEGSGALADDELDQLCSGHEEDDGADHGG